jgi:hypothetical protein
MLLKHRCGQVLRQRICYHLVGSALHQLDNAIFDELVDEMLTRVNVSRHCYNCPRVLIQVHGPQLRESKFTHDDTQVQKLLTSLTGGMPLAFGCAEGTEQQRDTLFCFTDFQLIEPPFIIIT